MKQKYQVTFDNGKTWETCKTAVEIAENGHPNGWLHYLLKDGTNGMRRPSKPGFIGWRIKPSKSIG